MSASGPSGSHTSAALASGLSPRALIATTGAPSIASSAATVSVLSPDCETSTNASPSFADAGLAQLRRRHRERTPPGGTQREHCGDQRVAARADPAEHDRPATQPAPGLRCPRRRETPASRPGDSPAGRRSPGGSRLPPLSLHRARREPADDVALEHDRDQDGRQRREDPAGGLQPEVGRVATGELRDRDRDRLRGRRRGEDQRIQELVPRDQEREQHRREQAGPRERQDHPEQRPDARAAVDSRRILEIARDRLEVVAHDPQHERRRERAVDDDQPDPRVEQMQADHDQVQRDHEGDRRDHVRGEEQQQRRSRAAKPQPRERVGAEHADRDRDRDGGGRDDQAVEQRGTEVREDRAAGGGEDLRVAAEREVARDPAERNPEQLGLARQARDHQPRERRQEDERHDDGCRVDEDRVATRVLHQPAAVP